MNIHSRVIFHPVLALVLLTGTATLFAASQTSAIPGPAQITVLYDAFGKTPGVQKDWGYSALIEYAGKRILFDTGTVRGMYSAILGEWLSGHDDG